MAKTFEYSMKIPFDMSDVNGYIKIPQFDLAVFTGYRACNRIELGYRVICTF